MIPATRRRLAVLYVVVAALLISLGGRLWYLQVMTGVSYASAAARDQTRTVIVPSVRGEILDDTGLPLVSNKTSMVVSVNRVLLSQQPDGGIAELHKLAAVLGMSYAALQLKLRLCTAGVPQPCWQGSPYQPIPVERNTPYKIALQIMESQKQFPGVTAQAQPVVQYTQPYATDAAQTLGYLQPITPQEVKQRHLPVTGFSGVDLVGQAGLEQQYDTQLRGTPGRQKLTVNSVGEVTGTQGGTPAKPGADLVTSINATLQADVYQVLASSVHKAQAEGATKVKTGAAVVMTTKGRVVAMASYPSYNPDIWTNGVTTRQFKDLFGHAHGEPILNRVTQGQYGPGSTWKVTSTAAAMTYGLSAAGPYGCPGQVKIAGRVFHDWTPQNLGPMSLHQALVMSCDTVFYEVAYKMYLRDHYKDNFIPNPKAPPQWMQKMEVAWGFGKSTGVDLPEQSLGAVPTRQWLYNYWKQYKGYWCKHGRAHGTYIQQVEYDNCRTGYQWTPGQAAITSIGQGYVSVTPLQLARAYAALANGGTLYDPRVGEALVSPVTGKVISRITPPVGGHLPVPAHDLAYIRNALKDVVTQGTAVSSFHGFPFSKLQVAAKTGTAQILVSNEATSLFASFAPLHHPKYVVVVVIPHSGEGPAGADSWTAGRQIWDDIYGLEGQKGAFPGGRMPSGLPRISPNGAITPPAGFTGGK